MRGFTESVVEDAALALLESLGYAVLQGPEVAVGMPGAERGDPNYRDVVLEGRLATALVRLNRAGRLVGEEDRGAVDRRAGDGGTLLPAAGAARGSGGRAQ
jgi:hypothetical protein